MAIRNNSNLRDRLLKIIELKFSSKRDFYLQSGLGNGFLDKNTSINTDSIEKIISVIPDLNINWLVFGKGEMLLTVDSSQKNVSPTVSPIVSPTPQNTDIEGKNLRVLAITVDKAGKENIQFVPLAAQAGYLQHIGDPEWVAELPSISLTGFESGSFRAFEVKGDSMEPTFYPSDRIICRYLEDFTKCRSGERYVIITEQDGIVVKQVRNLIKTGGLIECISDNTTYGPYTIEATSIREMWHVKGLFRVSVIGPSNTEERLRQLEKEIRELRGGKK